jgi:hypothetical protein
LKKYENIKKKIKSKKKVKPWDKKGHTKLYSDILTISICYKN